MSPHPSPFDAGDVAEEAEAAAGVSPETAVAFERLGRLVMTDAVFRPRTDAPGDADPMYRARRPIAEAWREAHRGPCRVVHVLAFLAVVERASETARGERGRQRIRGYARQIADIRATLTRTGGS